MNELKEITFVTHNKGKVMSAQRLFDSSEVKLEIFNFDLDEPRSDDIKYIAKSKVEQAYDLVKKPCIALDTGFFVHELGGFPRAFVNFALDTIGIAGILKLMEGKSNRDCYFGECLAYYDGNEIKYFEANIDGTLSTEIMGSDTEQKWSELWYIFKLLNSDLTMAQMTETDRNKIIDNANISALHKFANWINSQI